MREPPLPAPWNRGPLAILYLFLIVAATAFLRFAGRGWITAIIGGLIVAGALFTLLVLLGSRRT